MRGLNRDSAASAVACGAPVAPSAACGAPTRRFLSATSRPRLDPSALACVAPRSAKNQLMRDPPPPKQSLARGPRVRSGPTKHARTPTHEWSPARFAHPCCPSRRFTPPPSSSSILPRPLPRSCPAWRLPVFSLGLNPTLHRYLGPTPINETEYVAAYCRFPEAQTSACDRMGRERKASNAGVLRRSCPAASHGWVLQVRKRWRRWSWQWS